MDNFLPALSARLHDIYPCVDVRAFMEHQTQQVIYSAPMSMLKHHGLITDAMLASATPMPNPKAREGVTHLGDRFTILDLGDFATLTVYTAKAPVGPKLGLIRDMADARKVIAKIRSS